MNSMLYSSLAVTRELCDSQRAHYLNPYHCYSGLASIAVSGRVWLGDGVLLRFRSEHPYRAGSGPRCWLGCSSSPDVVGKNVCRTLSGCVMWCVVTGAFLFGILIHLY
jgi:hypothetical protein